MIICDDTAWANFSKAAQALAHRMPSLINDVTKFYISIVNLFGNLSVLKFVFADTYAMSNHSVDGQEPEVRSQRYHRKRRY